MSVAEDIVDGFICCECMGPIETDRMRAAGGEIEDDGITVTKTPGYPLPCAECRPGWRSDHEADQEGEG